MWKVHTKKHTTASHCERSQKTRQIDQSQPNTQKGEKKSNWNENKIKKSRDFGECKKRKQKTAVRRKNP